MESAARRTYGMFKVDPETAREIAESDDITYLEGKVSDISIVDKAKNF